MCSGAREEGGRRASDLPRGAVIAVSQHLNEGRIERSHGHGGEGRARSGSPSHLLHPSSLSPASSSLQFHSRAALPNNEHLATFAQRRRSGERAQLATHEGRGRQRRLHLRDGPHGQSRGNGDRARRILNIILGISAQFLTFFCPEFLWCGHFP